MLFEVYLQEIVSNFWDTSIIDYHTHGFLFSNASIASRIPHKLI